MRNSRTLAILVSLRNDSRKNLLLALSLLLLLSPIATAQTTTTSHSDIATPGGLAAGSPAGSYQLSGFENVNLYNGNLDFHLPLIAIGGRGSATFPITLSLNTKQWHVEHTQTQTSEGWYPSRAYWGTLPGYSAGVMQGRRTGFGIKVVGGCSPYPQNKQFYQTTLTTLTFTGPDGTEYEFRDQLNGGARMPVTAPCPTYPYTGASRGTVWVTTDGSAATFISDSPINDLVDIPTYHRMMSGITGYLMLRDGTKYRISGGGVAWIRDRNGNMIYNNSDALGRQFGITVVGDSPTHEHQISYKGFGGTARVIRITHDLLQNALRPGFSLHTPAQLFPELPSGTNFPPFNPLVVTSVILPNGQTYQFKYNDYGELARVVLPTGGAIEYDMTPTSGVIYGHNGQGDDYEIYRRVVERRTYKDGSATPVTRTVYVAPADGAGPVEVKHYDGTNGVLTTLVAVEKHYFATNRIESLIPDLDGQGFPVDTYTAWNEGKETVVENYAIDGTSATTLLRRTVNNWQAGATLGGFSVNPRIADTTTTLSDSNQVSKQVFAYDQCTGCNPYFNNQTDVYEYDFGTGAAGTLIRRTHTDYVTAANYTDALVSSPHLRSLPTKTLVYSVNGGNEIERARATFEYDNYTAAPPNHAGLIDRPNIINFDSAFNTSYLTRGNVTATSNYLFTNGTVTGSVTTFAQYDVAGNVLKAIDARGYETTLDFSDRFGAPDAEARANAGSAELNAAGKYSYAFATSVTNALGHTAYAQFDYYLGQPVDGENANGIVASGFYNDALDRPTQVVRANNQDVSVKSQTTFGYDDTNRIITTSSDQDSFNDPTPLKSLIVYDGLGRTTEKRQFENSNDFIAVRQTYDGLGRSYQTSNPFRATESILWTTTGYDALSRVTSVTTPDNATVSTSYSGNTVTVTDQAGKQRKSVTDALGRLKEVYEAPAGVNYLTSYNYDVLDNLTTVNQGTQARYFMYDSLKRLLRVRNPEQDINADLNSTDPLTGNSQWTMTYNYDNNGNLTVKTDARRVSSTYTYDALNRNTSIIYSDGTPRVNRYYDTSVRGIGRLAWEETVNVFAKVVDIYDVMGQPVQYRQRFRVNNDWGNHFWGFANYDKAGHLTTMTYPSGRTVTNTYDGAGRLDGFTGNLGDATQRTYASGVSYSSFGGMTQEQFGTNTPIYNKRHYNIRGQLYDVRASTFSLAQDEFNWNRGCLALYYGGAAWGQSSTTNNGNVTMQQHWVPTDNPAIYSYVQDSYVYDSLNRLTSVTEVHGNASSQSGPDFQQSYNYDRWGNRTIDGNPSKTWGANINSIQAVADQNSNRMYAPNDPARVFVDYDEAGNQTKDYFTSNGTRAFDAENRMKSAINNGITNTYTYDGDGKRIKRNVNRIETWQVYGLGGELLAEYAANTSPSAPQKEYGYRNGELLITAEPGTPQGGSGEQNVTWTNAVGVSVSGNSLTKTAPVGWGNSGASSTQSITSGDGYVEFTVSETSTLRMCGLSVGDSNQDYMDIDYAFYPWQEGVLYIFEGGVSRGTFGTYANGDRLRIAIEGGVVKYRKNSTLLYTSAVTPSYPLLADTSLFSTGGTVSNAVIGTGPVNVAWTNAAGVSVSGNNLTKTAANFTWGNAGAASTQSITSGNGYVEFTATETNTLRMCGLSVGDANQDYTDIDYAVYLWQDSLLYIFEGGVSRGTFGTYAAGDKLRVAVEGGVVKYRKNGTLLYTSTVAPSYPLLVDTSLYSIGSTLSNVVISGNLGGSTAAANIRWLVTDQLGTPRMILDQTGSLANISRHDYLPFGEEVPANFRTGIPGYATGDNVRQKFTQKERDNETGLDYFVARNYGSSQGRFISADSVSGSPLHPQTFNLYSYVRNNPLRFIDPTGHWAQDPKVAPADCCGPDNTEIINTNDSEQPKKKREPLPPSFADWPIFDPTTYCPTALCGGMSLRRRLEHTKRVFFGSERFVRQMLPDGINVSGNLVPGVSFTVTLSPTDFDFYGGAELDFAGMVRRGDLFGGGSVTGTYILDPSTRGPDGQILLTKNAQDARRSFFEGNSLGGLVCRNLACVGADASGNKVGLKVGGGTPGTSVGVSRQKFLYHIPVENLPFWKGPR